MKDRDSYQVSLSAQHASDIWLEGCKVYTWLIGYEGQRYCSYQVNLSAQHVSDTWLVGREVYTWLIGYEGQR